MPPENDEVHARHEVGNVSLVENDGPSQREHEASCAVIPPDSESNGQEASSTQTEVARRPQAIAADEDNDDCDPESDRDSAQAVFQASLTFQSTHTPIPSPYEIDHRTSSGSLYPSIESISQAGNSDWEVDKHWEASARAGGDGRENDSDVPAVASVCPTARHPASWDAFRAESREEMESSDDVVMAETVGVYEEGKSLPAEVLDSPVDNVSYNGRTISDYSDYASLTLKGEENYDHNNYGDANDSSSFAMRPQNAVATSEDDDLVALKRAAYGGSFGNGVAIARTRDQEAESTVVEYDVHPADISDDAVHAEFLGVDYLTTLEQITPAATTPQNVYEVLESGTEEEATEATVIDSSPVVEKATAEAWSSSLTEEARVLSDDAGNGAVADVDSKPPAVIAPVDGSSEGRVSSAEPWTNTVGRDGNNVEWRDEEAEVVGITEDVHPSEIPENAAHAELIGTDFSASAVAVPSCQHEEFTRAEGAGADSLTFQNEGAEVVAISEEVNTSSSEAQAEFIGADFNYAVAVHSCAHHESTTVDGDGVNHMAYPDDEAEVLDIREDVRPSETSDGAAQAELVQDNYNSSVAISSNPLQHSDTNVIQDGILEGTAIVTGQECEEVVGITVEGSDNGHNEVQATLVGEDYPQTPHETNLGAVQTPVAAFVEQSNDDTTELSTGKPSDFPTRSRTNSLHSRSASAPEVFSNLFDDIPRASLATFRDAIPALGAVVEYEWNSQTFDKGSSCVPSSAPIASVIATEVDTTDTSERSQELPVPRPASPVVTNSSTSWASARSEGSNSQSQRGLQALSNNISNVMEMLFGDTKPNLRQRNTGGVDVDSFGGSILPRTLLPSSVIYSEATNSWVATVNTNQKALECNNVEESSKSLRAFSVPTKKQAMCLAKAWAPPRMHPFPSNPVCFICESKFAVFRRACHCRNCGVCICSSCSVQWPSKMLPATYKNSRASVNICKACDWLCSAFRLALLQGDHDKAVALNATGNLNLTTPFANVKGELFYPVHCAVLGGNLSLLKWLVDEHCCPLRSIRISNGRQRDSSGSYTPILTSKGRSLLGIALENRNIDIVQYLVVEKRMHLSAETDLSVDTLIQNLDLLLRVLPEEVLQGQTFGQSEARSNSFMDNEVAQSLNCQPSGHGNGRGAAESELASDNSIDVHQQDSGDDVSNASVDDACIICFSNTINCVATPCGHQICCLECSNNVSRCPVCAVECSFMRVFKP